MEIKSVILLLDSLPAGLKANIAAVLGMSLGHYYPELVGGPATTACGRELPGITTIPVPILSADETVLSEIYLTASDLDLVVPFDDDTPRALIVACMPEILVKGGDYTAATTAGAAEVIAAGGRFVAVPFAFDRSTTALIAKVRRGRPGPGGAPL